MYLVSLRDFPSSCADEETGSILLLIIVSYHSLKSVVTLGKGYKRWTRLTLAPVCNIVGFKTLHGGSR